MSLFSKKCEYCREKIGKGSEIILNVKALGFIGLHKRYFCSDEHADKYKKEIEVYLKKSKKEGCC